MKKEVFTHEEIYAEIKKSWHVGSGSGGGGSYELKGELTVIRKSAGTTHTSLEDQNT